ncbi:MAG: hypothetical protein KGZ58_08945 [Ignavibacteriales bacterium]|nr:hypothetical protein [Ignavibacteriales bacterium]
MSKDYIPSPDTDFSFWSGNLLSKIEPYKPTFGITDAEIDDLKVQRDTFEKSVKDTEVAKTTLQSLVETKNTIRAKFESVIRKMVAHMKTHKDYTPAIGEDLGVVLPATPSKGSPTAKPTFTATLLATGVRLDWPKDIYSGVIVQGKRGEETAFILLGTDTRSPFEDTRVNINPAKPETRIFRMRYVLNDEEVGLWSDEVKVYCLIDEGTR